jgi:hypothetical protein
MCTYPFLHNVPNAAQLVPHLLNASTNAVQARDGCCRESRVRERASGEAQPAMRTADAWRGSTCLSTSLGKLYRLNN